MFNKCCNRLDRWNERLVLSEFPESDTDISFVSSERTSVDRFSVHYDYMDISRTPRLSTSSDHSFGSRGGQRMNDINPRPELSFMSQESGWTSTSSQHSVSMFNFDWNINGQHLQFYAGIMMYGQLSSNSILSYMSIFYTNREYYHTYLCLLELSFPPEGI